MCRNLILNSFFYVCFMLSCVLFINCLFQLKEYEPTEEITSTVNYEFFSNNLYLEPNKSNNLIENNKRCKSLWKKC